MVCSWRALFPERFLGGFLNRIRLYAARIMFLGKSCPCKKQGHKEEGKVSFHTFFYISSGQGAGWRVGPLHGISDAAVTGSNDLAFCNHIPYSDPVLKKQPFFLFDRLRQRPVRQCRDHFPETVLRMSIEKLLFS